MNTDYPASTHTWYKRNAEVSVSSSVLLLLVAAPVLFFLWLLAQPGGETVRLYVDDLALCVAAAGGAVACFLAAQRYGNTPMGRSWAVLCFGMAAMTFGEVAWAVQEIGLNQEVSSPAVSDIGYLAFYPFVFIGLFTMPQAPVTGLRRFKLALDITVCISAFALVSSHFVIAELLRNGDGTWQAQAIGITYPIGDLAIVLAAVVVATRGHNHASVGIMVLAFGFFSIAVSDSLFTYLTEVGDYYSGSLIDTGWVLGYCLIAMAGLLTAGRRLDIDAYKEDQDDPVPLWQGLALQAAIIPVGVTLFANVSGSTAHVDLLMLSGFIVLGTLTSVRQGVTHHENHRLNVQLEQMTKDLSARVQTERMRSYVGNREEAVAEIPPVPPPPNDTGFHRPDWGPDSYEPHH